MSPEEIKQAQAICDAATAPQGCHSFDCIFHIPGKGEQHTNGGCHCLENRPNNVIRKWFHWAIFARTVLPKALRFAEELQKQNEFLTNGLNATKNLIRTSEAALTEAQEMGSVKQRMRFAEENSRLRAALEFFANEDNWYKDHNDEFQWIGDLSGGPSRAREALESK